MLEIGDCEGEFTNEIFVDGNERIVGLRAE